MGPLGAIRLVRSRARRLLLIPAGALVLLGTPALALDSPRPAAELHRGPAGPPATSPGPAPAPRPTTPADLVGVKWTGDPEAEFRSRCRTAGSDQLGAGRHPRWRRPRRPTTTRPTPARLCRSRRRRQRFGAGAVEDSAEVRVTVVSGTVGDVHVAAVSADGGDGAGWLGRGARVVAAGHARPVRLRRRAGAPGLVLGAVAVRLVAVAVAAARWRSSGWSRSSPRGVRSRPPRRRRTTPRRPQPAITMRSQWGPTSVEPVGRTAAGPRDSATSTSSVVHHSVTSKRLRPELEPQMGPEHPGVPRGHARLLRHRVQLHRSTATGRSSRVARAASTRRSSPPTPAASTPGPAGSRCSARTRRSSRPAAASGTPWSTCIAWKLSVHHEEPGRRLHGDERGLRGPLAGGHDASRSRTGSSATATSDLTACPGDASVPAPRRAAERGAAEGGLGGPGATTTTTPPTGAPRRPPPRRLPDHAPPTPAPSRDRDGCGGRRSRGGRRGGPRRVRPGPRRRRPGRPHACGRRAATDPASGRRAGRTDGGRRRRDPQRALGRAGPGGLGLGDESELRAHVHEYLRGV